MGDSSGGVARLSKFHQFKVGKDRDRGGRVRFGGH